MATDIRSEVRDSFHSDEKYAFSHVIPYDIQNYIDGLFHISMLAGASKIAGDDLLLSYAKCWILQLQLCGIDVRNYSPTDPGDWEYCDEQQLYVKRKAQSFAGPCALAWANKQGCNIHNGYPDITRTAKLLVASGWAYGYLVRWIKALRQHMNSIFMAYILLGKTPPNSMEWLTYDNPFYKYIYGKKYVIAKWPGRKTSQGHVEEASSPQGFQAREPDIWPAKNWVYSYYVNDGEPVTWRYTPICQLICFYLGQ